MTGSNQLFVADVETRPVILVVDDNALNRDALHRRLERDDYQVVEVEDGERALDYMRAHAVEMKPSSTIYTRPARCTISAR